MTTPQHPTDEILLANYLKGDTHALKQLIERYLKPILNFAYKYTRNHADAEDITQDVFIKFWKAAKRFNPKKKFSVWLYTIARRTIFDFLKKKKIPAFSSLQADEEAPSPEELIEDKAPLPLQQLMTKEQNHALEKVILELPPDYQATLNLHYQEDMTFEEIAVVLKKPMNTVKSWHRRALLALQKRLNAPK